MKNLLNLPVLFLLPCYLFSQGQSPVLPTGTTFTKSLAISPDGKTIAVEGESYEVALWDLATRKKTMTLKRAKLKASTDDDDDDDTPEIPSFAMGISGHSFFSQTGQHLINRHDRGVVVWNIKQPRPAIEIFAQPDYYDVSPDGQYVVVVEDAMQEKIAGAAIVRAESLSSDNLLLYKVLDGALTSIPVTTHSQTMRLRFIPGTNNLLVSGFNGDLTIIDWTSGKVLDEADVYKSKEQDADAGYFPEGFMSRNMSLAVHPTKTLLAVTDVENHLYIYDFKSHQVKHTIAVKGGLDMPGQYFEHLQFTPNGKYLMGISSAMSLKGFKKVYRFWDVGNGKEVKTMEIEAIWSSFCFSPDAQWFVLGKMDNTQKPPVICTVYNNATLEPVDSFSGKGALSFFPNDSQRLAYLAGSGIGIYTIKK